jgi:putative membrane-bound dehydrogenase-like protein
MTMKRLSLTLSGLFLIPLAAGGQPVVKTGACPELTRYRAPSGENWNQFPQRPNGFESGTIQDPLAPEQSINCIQTPEGLRAELWASEKLTGVAPGLGYIQHFTFDERGRMWAVEPRSYPNTILPASGNVNDQKFTGGQDRILILEDTDGDKVADKVKVFRDKLNLPQSIEVVNGGVVVTMAPYLVFFPNDNDTAGTPRILWSGMGNSGVSWDTHGSINSLMYGLDNWIYGHSGGTGCNAGGVDCGWGRVWRFRHTALGHARTEFEAWTEGPANAWGIGQMEDGQIFQSGATGTPHINHSLRQKVRANDIRFPAVGPGNNEGSLYYPITGDRYLWEGSTAKNAQGWYTSGTTAVSGLQFYTSRLLPQKYWNRFAFTCEGASKLCNQDSLVVSGSGDITGSTWRAVRMPGPARSNLIASTDAWVAPLLAKTGPDGAVWVLDWYNYLFLHNPARPGGNCQDGIPNNGCAWNNHLREKERVRIYRITPADGRTEPPLNLANATVAQLVATFSNPNLHWRLQAQRLLLAKGYSAELGGLLEAILTGNKAVDAVGNNPAVVHALWTLHGLGQIDSDGTRWNPVLSKLLLHPAWGVRRNVLRAMPRNAASAQAIGTQCSVNDPHGHVRIQALLALSEISSKPAGLPAIWNDYRVADGANGIAATVSTAAGIASAATKPCEPTLDPASDILARPQAQPRSDLRFTVLHDGFRLLPHGHLPSGELTVSGPDGRILFQSSYSSRDGRWTNPQARGLRQSICVYRFRGEDGSLIQGRLSLAAGAYR